MCSLSGLLTKKMKIGNGGPLEKVEDALPCRELVVLDVYNSDKQLKK